ncbi:MAG: hypothetical protein Tsb0013_01030 [Phycisphaerales bacterium]
MTPRTLIAIALASILSGCAGYAIESSYNTDIKTLYLPIFDNTTFAYGLEAELTEAIAKEIHRVTPWRVTSNPGADTELRGAIIRVEKRQLSSDGVSGLVQELASVVTVSFEWTDADTGEVLVARQGFSTAEPYAPLQGAQERPETGEAGAIDRLARDIVAELRSTW